MEPFMSRGFLQFSRCFKIFARLRSSTPPGAIVEPVTSRCIRFIPRLVRGLALGGATVGTLGLCAIPIKKEDTLDGSKFFQPPDPATLTNANLIKGATCLTVGAVTSLLTQTTAAILEALNEYTQAVKKLTDITNKVVAYIGHDTEQHMWDLELEARYEVNTLKRDIEEMQLVFENVFEMTEIASRTAYQVGAENAATTLRMMAQQCESQVQIAANAKNNAEIVLAQAKVLAIEKTVEKNDKSST